MLGTNNAALAPLLTNESMCTLAGTPVQGAQAILQALQSVPPLSPDAFLAQPLPTSNGVMLLVHGRMNTGNVKFSQVFTLMPSGSSFVILNMLLRDI